MMFSKNYSLGIVGTCGMPAAYGGFETLAEAIVKYLASPEYRVLVFAQKGYSPVVGNSWDQIVIPLGANGVSSIIYDISSLFIASSRCHCILVLGVSGAISLPILRVCFPTVKYIVHIDGLEWLRPKWGGLARWFLKLSERISIHFSDAFIVDNVGIADYVSRAYGKRYLKRASLLAYGAAIPSEDLLTLGNDLNIVNACTGETLYIGQIKYFLVLGRAEPENNFDMIIHAYIDSALAIKGVMLLILSNALTTHHGKALLLRYSSVNGLCFACPEYDYRKVRAIRMHAMAYIHGHSAGGTNPSLVEAIAASKPIFAFDVPYNRFTTAGIASYFSSSLSLKALFLNFIVEGIDTVPELRSLAIASYDWDIVTRDYYSLFSLVVRTHPGGIRTLMGRLVLRSKRKVTRILLRLLHQSRHSRLKTSHKYEFKLPNEP